MTEFLTSPLLIWVAAFAFTVATMIGIYAILLPGKTRIPRARRRGSDRVGFKANLDEALEKADERIGERLKFISAPLDAAGLPSEPARIALFLGLSAFVGALLGALAGGTALALLLILIVPLGWRGYMGYLISKRRRAFGEQLEETLQMIAASLRAGFGLLQALGAVSNDAIEPTKSEFARVLNETRVGMPLSDSLDALSKRLESEDFGWVSQAIAINREVGGNLADTLDGVATTIRERNTLKRQVRSLSAEGRMSAIVLYALPIVFGGLMYLMNPSYILVLFSDIYGWMILGVALVLMIVGGLWLKSIVNIKF